MLSYQHGYHAGCVADVVKHITLVCLLRYLGQKEKPYLYLETHAGKGRYDLRGAQAVKTGEAAEGIERLWAVKSSLPDSCLPYVDIIKKENASGALRYYPGSPLFAAHCLRKQDRLLACELHPQEYQALTECSLNHRLDAPAVQLFNRDGLDLLSSVLPPAERRGLMFVDPSYEIKSEYRTIPEQIKRAYRRFSTGIYCVWYPIVDKRWRDQLVDQFRKEKTPFLRVEFYWGETQGRGMMGTGLWIINPPYVLADELRRVLNVLRTVFNPGVSSYLIETE